MEERQAPAAESTPPRRVYNPRTVFVPVEHAVKGHEQTHTALRTADGDIYIRHTKSGTIRRWQPKIRGKAARRADKRARRVHR